MWLIVVSMPGTDFVELAEALGAPNVAAIVGRITAPECQKSSGETMRLFVCRCPDKRLELDEAGDTVPRALAEG